eukprot:TRINITY_DN653_c0_g1_i8.p1 TRINITY_DN653_c0_g1~~TRINITY_DN653_c0_g1_i8.p1  ORF type:complete len:146 (+),score=52.86 TRINITY_DN653_c0_g1_i8:29-439(+)
MCIRDSGYLMYSTNNGETWSKPVDIPDSWHSDMDLAYCGTEDIQKVFIITLKSVVRSSSFTVFDLNTGKMTARRRPFAETQFMADLQIACAKQPNKDRVWLTSTGDIADIGYYTSCLLYTSPSPRDLSTSRMPSSA